MAIKYETVIIFGPTGAVGGAAAVEAHKRGAKVWLAMRDPTKAIPAISKEEEQSGSYSRIKADLSDPKSVKEAVQQSQAKAAFTYFVRTGDGLKSSLQAMKDAGIDRGKGADPYFHAQVEISLEDLGIAHTSLRPAQFASNTLKRSLNKTKQPWEAWILFGDLRGDAIAPRDIGRVGGAVLVDRPSAGSKEIVYLCGPKILTVDQQWDIIKKVTGKEFRIIRPTKEEYAKFLSPEVPTLIVNYLIATQEAWLNKDPYPEAFYSENVANITKYSGYEPTSLEEFVASYPL
ncbi:hypothetical protein DV736_g2961, partial [Chaetothyriales sp. CBS 134916]